MIQDDLYSRIAKHLETVCLKTPRRFQNRCIKYAYNSKPDTSFPHEDSAL